ncbi:AAA family ATPase, partial [Phocaeicola vulgatus]|nr:AAA family ATPase [Phocaeicola vulgatus]
MGTYLIDFPNNEVRKGLLSVLAAHYLKPGGGEVNRWIIDAVTSLEQGNTSAFCDSLTPIHP